MLNHNNLSLEKQKKFKAAAIKLSRLRDDFDKYRDAESGKNLIKAKLKPLEDKLDDYLAEWHKLSREDSHVYPSQGILHTPFDYLDCKGHQLLAHEQIVKTLRMRRFFLELYNHPYRMHYLHEVNSQKFVPPPKVGSLTMESSAAAGLSLSVGDLAAAVMGAEKERVSRNERFAQGPFVKLGRQARHLFVGSESPDVWNSAPAIATMAALHCLSALPRNGVTSDLKRQTDLAREVFTWLRNMADEILAGRPDKKEVLKLWLGNVTGALEANTEKALKRAEALYAAGVRSFRIYSPEPGTGPVETVKALKKRFKNTVEIFSGQITSVDQARAAEAAGADGIYVGIGGGGRCITGVRSGSVIDWPELVWKLRGEINIPVIVQGGASDHIAVTLLLGASGVGVSRVVSGGTIESPGGALYCIDSRGKMFKPYGGEASARIKYLDGKLLPFDIPAFVEGEISKALLSYISHVFPTLTYNLHLLNEDAILALVFRGVNKLEELHALDPSPLRQMTNSGQFQQNSH